MLSPDLPPGTLRVRHELAPANVRLLATLGWGYVIDPAAPACVRFHDRSGERLECRRCRRVERARLQAAQQA